MVKGSPMASPCVLGENPPNFFKNLFKSYPRASRLLKRHCVGISLAEKYSLSSWSSHATSVRVKIKGILAWLLLLSHGDVRRRCRTKLTGIYDIKKRFLVKAFYVENFKNLR